MKTICNISRFIGEIFVFVGKFGLFVYFVLGKHNKEKAAIFGYAAFLIYVSMINHKSEIPQYRFSIEAPEK